MYKSKTVNSRLVNFILGVICVLMLSIPSDATAKDVFHCVALAKTAHRSNDQPNASWTPLWRYFSNQNPEMPGLPTTPIMYSAQVRFREKLV